MDQDPIQVFFAADLSNISGVDTVHTTLAKAFRSQNIPSCFLSLGGPSKTAEKVLGEFQCQSVPTPHPVLRIFHPRGRDWSVFSQRQLRKHVIRHLTASRPAWWVAGHLRYLWLETRPEGIRQLGIVHAPDDHNIETAERYHKTWDACVAVSQQTADAVLEKIPSLAPKLRVIPNGIEIPSECPIKTRSILQIVWCGRVEQAQKRVFDLIELTRELDKAPIEYQLHVIGDGPDKEKLEGEWQHSISQGRVIMHGRLTSRQVIEKLEAAHVTLSVSAYEGTPMALMEGIARACVPVATRGCGGLLPFMQNQQPTTLFEVADIPKAASAITRLAQDIDTTIEMGLRCREAFSRSVHTAESMAEQYAELLRHSKP
jgi:glycosyltransferase involved in cell wall biosynthesis